MRRIRASLVLLSVIVLASPAAAQLIEIGRPIKTAKAHRAAHGPHVFRLGVVDPRPTAGAQRVEPFRARLADVLETEVVVRTFDDEPALIEALAAGQIDYAPLTAIGFATAVRSCECVEPIAAPRAADRSQGWHAVVLGGTGEGAPAKVGDLAHRRLAITRRNDAIGTRRLPLMLLARAGLTGERAPELVEVDGPRAALEAVAAGRADAAVAWSSLDGDPTEGWSRGTLADMVAAGAAKASDFRLVWSSPVLPAGPHAVRSRLEEASKRRLRDMLIQLDADPQVYEAIEREGSGGFARVGTQAYRPFIDLLTPGEPVPRDEPPATTGGTPDKG